MFPKIIFVCYILHIILLIFEEEDSEASYLNEYENYITNNEEILGDSTVGDGDEMCHYFYLLFFLYPFIFIVSFVVPITIC